MSTNRVFLSIIILCSAIVMPGCRQPQPEIKPLPSIKQGENTFSEKGSVREMTLSFETPQFPEHDGKGEFMSYCAMCHSLKYISMQPDFSRKTWEAEVTKMIVKYKAPIDSATAKKIVEYLVAVKSKS
jgi:hypothetical protein